ncbi:DUF1963 domain-containing protein [Conexibacter stalactiti]|uniref:DUF1963 domain-containing protein n=1 Tax=Conexibacter stalactiti TaxID=1940611 RepID=A0ABU4HWW2_9ACTN|nr:DUF1963 domain-containing protein [Conexibacter stalactiti]MDW5597720.1 DUF1963 domain-containing protein [Conexibacter stalactiti]MEC5038362.1 DUF1963 domain-containing protein [Conexibacter stalactiti]
MDRRGFFKSMLGKGLSHGARQVDAVVIPFERAAKAARDAMPAEPEQQAPRPVADEPPADVAPTPQPLPATGVATPVADEDLMRLAADVGLIRHVEAVVALSRRSVRLVPGDGPPPDGSRTRLGGAPDLPFGGVWPNWEGRPLAFIGQLDLAEASALGLEQGALPDRGVLLIFSALERTPSGSSPQDGESTRVLYVEPERLPRDPGARIGISQPHSATALELSSELTLPRVWSAPVQLLGLDAEEQELWEQVRRELAELQGVEPWDAGEPLRSRHHLLGFADESRADMQVACELAARGIDVGYGAPWSHPEAKRVEEVSRRWRLLLQLTVDSEAGWSFGRGRERLFVWGPEDDLSTAAFEQVRAIAR